MGFCKTGQEPIERQTRESGSCRVRVLLLVSSGSMTKTPVGSERASKRSRKKGEVNHWLLF